MDMVRFHREGIYGSYTDIDGWILKFYPYLNNKKKADLRKIKNISDLSDEIVRVPFLFYINSDSGTTMAKFEMELWAGFMGLKQNPETYNLKPEIGWAVNMLTETEGED